MDQAGLDAALELAEELLGDSLGQLNGDVAGESVGDDHVGGAGDEPVALDVADEVQFLALEQAIALLVEAGALALSSSPTLSRPTLGFRWRRTRST